MKDIDIIIIGAGASGLMAAKELAAAGLKICILEARPRTGGRIHTITESAFSSPIETGAEFIHGRLPVTIAALKEAGIDYTKITGDLWRVDLGKWEKSDEFIEHEKLLVKTLKKLEEDITVSEFLKTHFPEEKYASLRKSVKGYIEGYYSGSVDRTSAKAFLEEWKEEEDVQFRVQNGYSQLIDYLAGQCLASGGRIELSQIVKEVRWSKNKVEVITIENEVFHASRLIITVPLGIWQAPPGSTGMIKYVPDIPEKFASALQMGFGWVIKIIIEFEERFWKSDPAIKKSNNKLKDLGFLLSDAIIPTWWSQLPETLPLLTGWIGGPGAEELKEADEQIILDHAISSLGYLFDMKAAEIKKEIKASKIINWTAEPFTRGSYAYSTTGSEEGIKSLGLPVADTLFFAGEALFSGTITGTVEAALSSGKLVAENVLSGWDRQ